MADLENTEVSPASESRIVNRLAMLMVCLTWPLIWVGSLVTTYDAGMAVPDWPNTYGYNMFLYPISTWLTGPFDLLIEHGHRLLASLVGFVAILLLVGAWLRENRKWVVRMSAVALVAVIIQGALGGARVVLDARAVAMVHACFAQAFFVLCWWLVGVTSTWWRSADGNELSRGLTTWLGTLALLSYFQLVLGAQLRHVAIGATPGFFKMVVVLHVFGAAVIACLVLINAVKLVRCGDLTLSRLGMVLVLLVSLQWALGVGTWFVNYGWPWSLDRWPTLARFVIQSKGWHESIIVSSHVAIGSLILGLSSFAWLRAARKSGTTGFGMTHYLKRLAS